MKTLARLLNQFLRNRFVHRPLAVALLLTSGIVFIPVHAQTSAAPASIPTAAPPPALPYGASLTLEQARKAMAAADAEARKNGWSMTTAIIDVAGKLVLFQRMDNTAYLSVDTAIGKAETALTIRGPSKRMEDNLAMGGNQLRWLAVPGIFPLQGGVPIIVDGKIIGAIGSGGGTSAQDEQVSMAGAAALAK